MFRRGTSTIQRRLERMRHYRGHGVHSPFIYRVVREALMPHAIKGEESALYRELRGKSVGQRQARQLHNIFSVCGYESFAFDSAYTNEQMIICTEQIDEQICAKAAKCGTTVVILAPYKNSARRELCHKIMSQHSSTSIDNLTFIVLFNNHLPKQHFTL